MTSVGEEFPKEQARVRALREQYTALRGTPGVNVEFAVRMMNQTLARAEAAAISGDPVAIVAAYKELQEWDK